MEKKVKKTKFGTRYSLTALRGAIVALSEKKKKIKKDLRNTPKDKKEAKLLLAAATSYQLRVYYLAYGLLRGKTYKAVESSTPLAKKISFLNYGDGRLVADLYKLCVAMSSYVPYGTFKVTSPDHLEKWLLGEDL